MERTTYKGYVIDRDNLGRLYIYNTRSKYSEDSDRNYNCGSTLKEAKATIDWKIWRSASDLDLWDISADGGSTWTTQWLTEGEAKYTAAEYGMIVRRHPSNAVKI